MKALRSLVAALSVAAVSVVAVGCAGDEAIFQKEADAGHAPQVRAPLGYFF